MKKEKLIKLEEFQKLSPLKFDFDIAELDNQNQIDKKAYVFVTKKVEEMPYEIYSKVLENMSRILNDRGINAIIVDNKAFESLEIYEFKTNKENMGDIYVTTNP